MNKYNSDFYATIRPGIKQSAAALVPILVEEFEIKSDDRIIDVGCGEGHWALEFANHGCEVIGLDGPYHPDPPLGTRFLPHNLSQPLPEHLVGRFEVAVCLEVAEHLQPKRAASFVAELCALAPLVIFSAAIPGQGGTGHLNEQWPDYWAKLFQANGFSVDGDLRYRIWDDERIENWYRQNLLVAWSSPRAQAMTLPLRLVHPVLWSTYR